jgi:hypothetical protein
MRRAVNTERRSMLALAVAVALAACLLALLATKPAEAAGRYKVVTKTFSGAAEIQVPADTTSKQGPASPCPSEIPISGLKMGRVLDVNVKLNGYSHTCPEQVDVLLVGPTGRNAIPMSDVAGCSSIAEGINLTVDDDEGAPSWPVPLTSGTYQPFDSDTTGSDSFPAPSGGATPPQGGGAALSAFDGTNPNGVWRLYIVDDDTTSLGRLAGGWSLEIKAKVRR